jgi:PBP1b-binding outer membrane lipoprotein LpoB
MKRVATIIYVAILAVILTGCMGAAPIKRASGPDTSAAYGNITLPDNKVITHVMCKRPN